MRKTRFGLPQVLAACGLIYSGIAFGDVDYSFRAGAAYNDNVRRAAMDEEDSTVGIVGLSLDASHESRRIESNANIEVDHRIYSGEQSDNETVGAAIANVLFSITPEFFEWFGEYNYGVVQTDPFGANEPGNRGNVNTLTTGPNLHLGLGRLTSVDLQGRYITTQYEERDIDNEVLQGDLSLARALSSNRSVSLNLSAGRTEYATEVADVAFDRQAAFLALDSTSARGNLRVSAGYNEVHDAGRVIDGVLFGLTINRELSSRTTLSVDYDQRLSDAGDLFRRYVDIGQGFGDVRDITDVENSVESSRLGVTLSLQGRASTFDVGLLAEDMDFETANTRDRRRVSIRAGMNRELGSAWRFDLEGRLRRNEFSTVDREDDDFEVRLGLNRELTSNIGVRFQYEFASRSSDEPLAEYDQNEYSLMFTYGN